MNPLFLALKAQINDYDKIRSDFSQIINGRWIPSENLHITISYFGDKYTVDELLEKLPSFVVPLKPFKLVGLGYFEANKILYAKGGTLELDSISTSIADAFSLEQKTFIAHATLMRIKSVEDRTALKKLLDDYKDREIGSVDTTLQLMQSHIKHPGGASYKCIKSFN